MLVMIIIGWLVTVAGFLLYVRHLRVKYSREVVAALVNKAADALNKPYEPSKLPAMNAPIKKPKKVFSSKSKTGKQRKTVTVKRRVTK